MEIKYKTTERKTCWEICTPRNEPTVKMWDDRESPELMEYNSEPVVSGRIFIDIERKVEISAWEQYKLWRLGYRTLPDMIYKKTGKYPLSIISINGEKIDFSNQERE